MEMETSQNICVLEDVKHISVLLLVFFNILIAH